MRRGTTPTHTFELPPELNGSLIAKAMVIYSQNDKEVFNKKTEDCDIGDNYIRVTLSQEDTFKFSCKKNVEIQLRIVTHDGKASTSDVIVRNVYKCLNDEVM